MNFGTILRKADPFITDADEAEVRELVSKLNHEEVTKFNHMHDTAGRFSDAAHHVVSSRGASDSWKGGANVSRGSRYGETTSSSRSAMLGGKGKKRMGA